MGASEPPPDNPTKLQTNGWDLALFSAGSLLFALTVVLVARSSRKAEVGARTDPFTGMKSGRYVRVGPGHHWLRHLSCENIVAIIVVVGIIVLLGLVRALRRITTTSIRKLLCDEKAILVYASFATGIGVGGLVRFVLGSISISGFATGSATSTTHTTDAKWSHFKPSRWGQCKPSFRVS